MTTVVLRIWLPDRPGALGAVASRIGAVRGDLVGIDILERGGGRVIDELVVELPNEGLLPLLVKEVSQVDGVDVEDARPGRDKQVDPRLDALELAARLVDQSDRASLLEDLTAHLAHALEAEWVAAVRQSSVVASVGEAPAGEWLAAFVAGSQSSESVAEGHHGPEDVACAALGSSDLAVVLGRQGAPFRARERRQLAALARIAGRRLTELS